MKFYKISFLFTVILLVQIVFTECYGQQQKDTHSLKINELEYLEMPGLNVMLAHDYYPGGHQSGISIIQNGVRVGSNGDIRLEPAPGPGHAQPKVGQRMVDRVNQVITVYSSKPLGF